jgi:hypothetical protein
MAALAKRWKWNKRTVIKFLSWLEKREMLHRRKSNIVTITSIRNYTRYQNSAPQSAPQSIHRVHTNKTEEHGESGGGDGEQKKTTSPVTTFLTFWKDEYQKRKGVPYVASFARDGSIVKRLLESLTLEQLEGAAVRFFGQRDEWIMAPEHGHTLANFSGRINGLLQGNGQKTVIAFLDEAKT